MPVLRVLLWGTIRREGLPMRRFFAWCSFVIAITPHWWWEFVRVLVVYEPAAHMLKVHFAGISVDTLAQICASGAFAVVGAWLIWPSRPEILRRHPIKISLERDSGSDRFGIQSFSGITYIQASVTTSTPLTNCKAWSSEVEYRATESDIYTVEQNERHPLGWSKHTSLEIDLNPHDPPARVNVAVYDTQFLRYELTGTPTNLFAALQRVGFHQLQLTITALRGATQISETRYLTIEWRGLTDGAFISLD